MKVSVRCEWLQRLAHVAQEVASVWCMEVDQQWREDAGKAKIIGYMRVSNEQVHHQLTVALQSFPFSAISDHWSWWPGFCCSSLSHRPSYCTNTFNILNYVCKHSGMTKLSQLSILPALFPMQVVSISMPSFHRIKSRYVVPTGSYPAIVMILRAGKIPEQN